LAETPQTRESVTKRAMDLLARREHSVYELRRKLDTRGLDPGLVDAAVTDLVDRGLVSDERYTETMVRSRRARGHGPLRIRADLKRNGVDGSVIDRWLDPDDPDWLNVMRRERSKKFGAGIPRDHKEWARQARFLQARGFSSEQIRRAMDVNDTDSI